MAKASLIPESVVAIREEICAREKCPHALVFDDPCASCPEGHWGQYEASKCAEAAGRGDKVARVARPVARAIDAVLGTTLAGCGGCKQMQQDLNAGMSVKNALKKRLHRRN